MLFNRLDRSRIAEIAQIEVGHVRTRLGARGLALHVSPSAVDWIARMGYDPAYGARPVRA